MGPAKLGIVKIRARDPNAAAIKPIIPVVNKNIVAI